ncbi:hypothetical protein EXS62_01645 [Candidatus Kaiserbacteria bacterium]|nr:hypothetical protein [Candidatus Kaiserbacteria bacterium]
MCGINSSAANAVVVTCKGTPAGLLSWEGLRRIHLPHRKVTEDDVMAFAVYLEKHGLQDKAEELLERYLAGYRV